MVERPSLYVGMLVAKVQQCPQFKAGVRNGNLNAVISGLLLGLRNKRVLIYVENTPDVVVLKIVVLLAFCFDGSSLLLLHGTFDQRLWHSAWAKFQLYISRKYSGSVCVPSQTIRNRGRGDRNARRRRKVSRLSRLAIAFLEAKQKGVRVDERDGPVSAL